MMGFKKIKNCKRTYNEQGAVYFTLATYSKQTAETREQIDRLIKTACMEYRVSECYEDATRAWMISGERLQSVVMKYGVREQTMCKIRRRIYEMF